MYNRMAYSNRSELFKFSITYRLYFCPSNLVCSKIINWTVFVKKENIFGGPLFKFLRIFLFLFSLFLGNKKGNWQTEICKKYKVFIIYLKTGNSTV